MNQQECIDILEPKIKDLSLSPLLLRAMNEMWCSGGAKSIQQSCETKEQISADDAKDVSRAREVLCCHEGRQ